MWGADERRNIVSSDIFMFQNQIEISMNDTHRGIQIIENTPSRMHTNSNVLHSYFSFDWEEFVIELNMQV